MCMDTKSDQAMLCMQRHPVACWGSGLTLLQESWLAETANTDRHIGWGSPPGPPVEEYVGLHILHHCLMDLSDILVIEFIPLPIDHILTIGNVVPTW